MGYYDNYVKRCLNPADEHREAIQQFVDYAFDNSSSYWTDVKEEVSFGSLEFRTIKVRVTSLVDAKTGQKINDDFRKIAFKDCSYQPMIGTRFKFNDNIWITYSTDNILAPTSGIYIRRCNNTINTQDEYNNIHHEPCYIDYTVTNVQPDYNNQIDIPNGTLYIKCQDNIWSRKISINSRILFNGVAYKVIERHHFEQMETDNRNTTGIITFSVKSDEIAPDDNLELSIANYKYYNYTIIAPSKVSGIVGGSGTIDYQISFGDKIITEEVNFTSGDSNIITIDSNGNYQLLSVGETNIKLIMKNNTTVTKTIPVEVTETIVVSYENIVSPSVNDIKINAKQNYNIYEYANGNKIDTKYTFEVYGVQSKCYTFTKIDDNNFCILNHLSSDDYLYVKCTNQRDSSVTLLQLTLGGLY